MLWPKRHDCETLIHAFSVTNFSRMFYRKSNSPRFSTDSGFQSPSFWMAAMCLQSETNWFCDAPCLFQIHCSLTVSTLGMTGDILQFIYWRSDKKEKWDSADWKTTSALYVVRWLSCDFDVCYRYSPGDRTSRQIESMDEAIYFSIQWSRAM